MALALASNVSFSARAVLTKTLKRRFPAAPASASDAQLFYDVSRWGVVLLLPFAALLDAPTLLRLLLDDGSGVYAGRHWLADAAATATGSDPPPPAPPPPPGVHAPPGMYPGNSAGGVRLLLWLLLNGCAHATYNGVSFVVLGRVSVASHAVLNIVRRIVCIAAAAVVFGTPVSAWNWAGVALAGLGVLAFARSKERGGLGGGTRGRLLPEHAVLAGKARAV